MNSPVVSTPHTLRGYGFKVRDVVRTTNHVLYFSSAPFGRAAVVIEDQAPDQVDTVAIEGDGDDIGEHLCLVHEGTIILTYPDADYVTYYSTNIDLQEGEYYIIHLDELNADLVAACHTIDDFFVTQGESSYQARMQVVHKTNELLEAFRDQQQEMTRLSTSLENHFKEIALLRERCNTLLQEGKTRDVLEINDRLKELLTMVESTSENYSTLVDGIMRS